MKVEKSIKDLQICSRSKRVKLKNMMELRGVLNNGLLRNMRKIKRKGQANTLFYPLVSKKVISVMVSRKPANFSG